MAAPLITDPDRGRIEAFIIAPCGNRAEWIYKTEIMPGRYACTDCMKITEPNLRTKCIIVYGEDEIE